MSYRCFWKKSLVVLGMLWCFWPGLGFTEALPVVIYAPAGPAAIPFILASESLPGVNVKIFTNHSQAHALFLKGEVPILCTGLCVGVGFFRQGVPVKIINSHVSGLTWLVTNTPVSQWKELRGKTLYLPFPGSPVEAVTRFFIQSSGLTWKKDVDIKYTGFPGATAMLLHHRIQAAALPEPFVSLVLSANGPASAFHILSYTSQWERFTGNPYGYPQVGTFVHLDFADTHAPLIKKLNEALGRAIQLIKEEPGPAVETAMAYMDFSVEILRCALDRTDFCLWENAALHRVIHQYYQFIGDPLNENSDAFF